MGLPFADLNWIAVIVAGLASMVAGSIWGMPFSQTWAKAHNVDFKELSRNPLVWVLGIAVQIVTAIALGLVLAGLGITQVGNAIVWALAIGIGPH